MTNKQQAQIFNLSTHLAFHADSEDDWDADVCILQRRLWITTTSNAIYFGITEPSEETMQKLTQCNSDLKQLGQSEIPLDAEFAANMKYGSKKGVLCFPNQLAYHRDLEDCWDMDVLILQTRLWATRHLNDIHEGIMRPDDCVMGKLNAWNRNLKAMGQPELPLNF